MHQMKYTLTATPTEVKNQWHLAIYGECERKVDETWKETPRESMLADRMMEAMIAQANKAEEAGLFEKALFRGYNHAIPANARKVMEMSIIMSANKKTKMPTVKRGDFKRFECGGYWNGCIHFLQEHVDTVFSNMRLIGRACEDPEKAKKIDEFCSAHENDGEIDKMFANGKLSIDFVKGL